MQTFALLAFVALAAAGPVAIPPPDDCEFASPCINPNAPCPCPAKTASATPTASLVTREPEPTDDDCTYKCAPCQPGEPCGSLCNPLPLPPQCDQCKGGCKPCRPGKPCPRICIQIELPPQCDAKYDEAPVVKRDVAEIVARTPEPEDATKQPDCFYKCPPCKAGEPCPAICNPLPLPPQCDQCKGGCKPCRSRICPEICIPIELPPQCDAQYGNETIEQIEPATIEQRSPEPTSVLPGTCDFECAPCKAGEACPALCDPLPLPSTCDQCAPRCKPCRPGQNCPKICEPVDLPPQCNNNPDVGDPKFCEPGACWMPPCLPGNSCIQQCQTPPWCAVNEKRDEIAGPEPTQVAADKPAPGYGTIDCTIKCKPCPPGQICTAQCIPLPLPPQCNVKRDALPEVVEEPSAEALRPIHGGDDCTPKCKPCPPGTNCPKICELLPLPPSCDINGDDVPKKADGSNCGCKPCPPGKFCTAQCIFVC